MILFFSEYHSAYSDTNSISESCYNPIDTTDFIVYWEDFRNSVLNHDTATLTSMLSDEINGECWFVGDEEYKLPEKFNGLLNKSIFLNRLDSIFTPPYMCLLTAYDIEKDLSNTQNTDWKSRYHCRTTIGQSDYYIYVRANEKQDSFTYTMGCSYGREREMEDYVNINLIFKQTSFGIKLCSIECEHIMIESFYDRPVNNNPS